MGGSGHLADLLGLGELDKPAESQAQAPTTSADVRPVAQVSEPAPEVPPAAPTEPAPRAKVPKGPGLLEANRVRAQQMAVKIKRFWQIAEIMRTEESLDDPYWTARLRRRCLKELKFTSVVGLNLFLRNNVELDGGLEALRQRWLKERDAPVVEEDAKDGKRPILKWTILDLFDRLQAHFNVVRDDDDDDPVDADPVKARSTWIAWRVFLAAAFGLKKEELDTCHNPDAEDKTIPAYPGLDDGGITPRGKANVPAGAGAMDIFTACTGRDLWPRVRAKLVNLIVGRRGGKSYITAIIGIYLATRKYKLPLGTKGMVMILARDKEQAGVIRGYIMAFLKVLPDLVAEFAAQPTQTLIELKNGVTIEVRATGAEGTRGYTVVAVLADEIAFWPTNDESVRQDKKVLRALRPAMLGVKNAMKILLSSPYAQRGVLYENYKKYFGKSEMEKWLVWQADTLTMRPSDDPDLLEEIQDEYNEDPENAAAEYGANFRTDLENIFSKKMVEDVCQQGRWQLPYNDAHSYRAFVDPSGGSADSYVLAIAHDEERTVDGESVTVPVLDYLEEWKPPFDPAHVSAQVVARCNEYHIHSVTGDAYGGEWPRDPLKKKGVDYELSSMNRSELYLAFLPLVNSGRCELLCADKYPRMTNQFANLERRTGRSGKDSVDHPPGAHDDVANGVAGVMVSEGGSGKECTW